jgi:hypothetical protein
MKNNLILKSIVGRGCLGVVTSLALAHPAVAALITYSADANTVHLYHLDEAAGGTIASNSGTAGKTAIAATGNAATWPTNATVLGAAAFSGYGNAADVSALSKAIAYDGDGDGTFEPDNASADDDILHSSFLGGGGEFTVEAMIKVASINATHNILSTDGTGGDSARGFTFRVTSAGNLQFRSIADYASGVYAAIPTSGANAWDANSWFHVAYAYNGSGAGTLYWTKVDPSLTVANSLGSQTTLTGTATPIPNLNGSIQGALVLGGENRGVNSDGTLGFIDEVRISNVARGAGDFIFTIPEPTGVALAGFVAAWATLSAGRHRRK